jgi:DNA adenine methylase
MIDHREIVALVDRVVGCKSGAPVRVLLACALAKAHRPELDIRKPFTEIGGSDAYSGRLYDEKYISSFVTRYQLPCNRTTGFLTPAFRTFNQPLYRGIDLSGKPKECYDAVIELVNLVQEGLVRADALLVETIRQLILLRDERQRQIASLKSDALRRGDTLTMEAVLYIIEKHLASPRSSRLPVLMVAAAYEVAQDFLRKSPRPLQPHTAADVRTGTLGDLEIISQQNDQRLSIVYEMKARKLTSHDIDLALEKIQSTSEKIDQYAFITTVSVDPVVAQYAAMLSRRTGVEFVILDCLQFIKQFLHMFYEIRMEFLNKYRELLLSEPESAVGHTLKRKFFELLQEVSGSPDEHSI